MGASVTPAELPSGIVVRPARDLEMRAARLLLPSAFISGAPETLVALSGAGIVLGAAAIGWVHALSRPSEPACFPLLVHVVPAARRQGVGRALVGAAAALCHGEADGIRTWSPIALGSEAAVFLDVVGFAPHRRMLFFETDGAAFHAMVERLRVGLQRAGRITAGSRIAGLHEAPAKGVASLLAGDFPAPATEILRRLQRTEPDSFDLDRSVALFVGEELAGGLLYSWNDGLPAIDALAVAPAFRGTAAVVLLLEAATRNGLEGGATRFRFSCDDDNRDTVNLARRCAAETIRVDAEYRLLFPRPG
ncbi:MAG: GNAT family N-acetyltransferase [Acetobacteraceae bacterium]